MDAGYEIEPRPIGRSSRRRMPVVVPDDQRPPIHRRGHGAPGPRPDWRLVGWWTDGGHVANLEGSIRQISPAGNRGISYLERTDQAAWPLGRYEFHVVTGSSAVELTVCITRRG